MQQTTDMTKGSCWKHIIIFAIPILLSNLFQQIYNSVDSLIVGNFLGTEALAAVSSSGSLIFLFTSFFYGTAMGAGVLIAKYFGQKKYDDMSKAIHTAIAFGLVASVIVTIVGVVLSPYILIWMDTDPEVLPNSIAYFRFYFVGITGSIMYNIFTGILQAVGNSRRPLYYLMFASILNICLDLLFIGGFKLGVEWAAIATFMSQILSATLCFLFLIKKGTVYQVQIKKIRFHKSMLISILKYGIPSGIQNSVIALANVVVQSNINSFGKVAMAGCGSYSKLEGFAFLPITSFTMAISTFISQNLGAREEKRAKQGATFGIITSVLLAEFIGLIMWLFAPNLISIFDSTKEVVEIGSLQCRTITLFYFLLAFSHCIAAVCRGAGKAFIPMIIMLAIWCILRVIYITTVLHFKHEIVLIFWAYPITWGCSSIIFLFYFLFSHWTKGLQTKTSLS